MCELCQGPGVELSSGLVICSDCFYGRRGHRKIDSFFVNRRFSSGTSPALDPRT